MSTDPNPIAPFPLFTHTELAGYLTAIILVGVGVGAVVGACVGRQTR